MIASAMSAMSSAMSGFEAMLTQPQSVPTQLMGEARKSVLRKLGASPRFTVARSQDPNAGRAAYATCNTPAGGFFVLYAGTWKQIKSDRMYTGVSSYVVEVNGWRIHPPMRHEVGVDETRFLAAMFNEPQPWVQAHTRTTPYVYPH